jgi:hypothetical protein
MELVIKLLGNRLSTEEMIIQHNKMEQGRRNAGVKTAPPMEENPELVEQLKEAISILKNYNK